MKKVFAILLAVMLLLSMTACGGATTQQEPETYVPSTEIEVVLAFVQERAVVVTQRLVEKELKAIELACCYYDAAGNRISSERVECTFSTQDTRSIWNFNVPSGCEYMDAIVASVTYPDGTQNVCPGVSTWIDLGIVTNLQTRETEFQNMKKLQGAAAENCPGATATLGELAEGKQKVEITAGDKATKNLVLFVLWYDEAGAPVSCDGSYVKNGEGISIGELKADEKATFSFEAPEGAAKAKTIVRQITFADDTLWQNEYYHEWAYVNYSAFE